VSKITRKSDGRRIFTDEFKRRQIGRVWRGELTIAELGRKLGIARSLLQRWKRLMPEGGKSAGPATKRVTAPGGLGAEQYILELQRLVGRQAVELELLRTQLEAEKKGRRS
jgi:transposase